MESLVVFFPVFSALFTGIFCIRFNRIWSFCINTICVAMSMALSWLMFLFVHQGKCVIYQESFFPWIDISELQIYWGLRLDMLSLVMLVVISTISFLVHVYSFAYMRGDSGQSRYFSYLAMFTACMMILVVSDNFLQMFCGWEGVGLCSYLLIGFWFHKKSANYASIKAFVVNRLADCGLVLGMCAIYYNFGSLNFDKVFAEVTSNFAVLYNTNSMNFICMCLLIGCMGKSAQIGFHVWLPDAMEGPTPVSALIHAATMVTAGIFLIVRCSVLFECACDTRMLMSIIGGLTCFFGASVAIGQNDIKKLIAYSTCSQLGYMLFACGVSAYGAGMFHLVTHAFFKSLLFLGAGSIIYSLHHEQDLLKMGGLRKQMRFTFLFMLVGSLSIVGVYPFSGYFSKDIVLEHAYAYGSNAGNFAFAMGLISVFFTAVYSFKLLNCVFFGEARHDSHNDVSQTVRDTSVFMLIPLLILTVFSCIVGYVGYKAGFYTNNFWGIKNASELAMPLEDVPKAVRVLPSVLSVFGFIYVFFCAKYFYTSRNFIIDFIKNKWFFDEIYNFILVRPMRCVSRFFGNIFDCKVIDALGPQMVTKVTDVFSSFIVKYHIGYVFNYVLVMAFGVLLVALCIFASNADLYMMN